MEKLCLLGAGSWGTALAIALSSRFPTVALWAHHPERAAALDLMRENTRYLPGFLLPGNVEVTPDLDVALLNADIVLSVTPAQVLRKTLRLALRSIPSDAILVSASKGIETSSFCLMTQVIAQEVHHVRGIAALSGPTFAREIAAAEPAALVIASADLSLAERVQQAFATPTLRLYTSTDIVGVELGAALKNVIAIGAGLCSGLGLGSNSVAALVTRGLAEISRLAVARGGHQRTLSGLAGLGDLVLTATGDQSRNRQLGIELGRGESLATVLGRMTMVAEGVETCRAAYQLGQRDNLDLPIISAMHQVLFEGKDARTAIRDLMDRPLTTE